MAYSCGSITSAPVPCGAIARTSSGIVSIAPLSELARREVELTDATLHRPVSRVRARLRVHMADVGADVEPCEGGLRLRLGAGTIAGARQEVAR